MFDGARVARARLGVCDAIRELHAMDHDRMTPEQFQILEDAVDDLNLANHQLLRLEDKQ